MRMTKRDAVRAVLSVPPVAVGLLAGYALGAVNWEYSRREVGDLFASVGLGAASTFAVMVVVLGIRWPIWLLAPASVASLAVLAWFFGVPPVASCYTDGWRIVCP